MSSEFILTIGWFVVVAKEKQRADYQACLELHSALKVEAIHVNTELSARYFSFPSMLRDLSSEVAIVASQTARHATNLMSDFREVVLGCIENISSIQSQLGNESPLHAMLTLDQGVTWLSHKKVL